MALSKFTIDKIKFKGNDYQYLKNKIIEKYNEQFPEYDISLSYKTSKKSYIFFIFNKMNVIDKTGEIKQVKILISQYTNEVAINIFAPEKKDELYQKYYYGQMDYSEPLKEYIDSVVTLYRLYNIDLSWKFSENDGYIMMKYKGPIKNSLKSFHLKYYNCVIKDEFEAIKPKVVEFAERFCK